MSPQLQEGQVNVGTALAEAWGNLTVCLKGHKHGADQHSVCAAITEHISSLASL